MNVQELKDEQKLKIQNIKKKWAEEMSVLFENWEKDRGKVHMLDAHLQEQTKIEMKYKRMIDDVIKSMNK